MIRKFECRNCGHRFEVDDQSQVACPQCNSDNVEFARSGKILWIVGGILVVAIFGGLWLWKACDTSNYPGNPDDVNPNDTLIIIPPKVEVGELTFEKDGYAFEAVGENIPVKKFYYAVLTYDHSEEIARSKDGHFTGVPACEWDSHTYDIAVFDAAADTIICLIDKPGFIKQKSVEECKNAEWIQGLIDQKDLSLLGAGENDYVAPDCKLIFQGLSSDAVNVPTTLSEVLEKLDMEAWTSVRVTAVDCDDMNRIAKIRLKVVEADSDF